MTLFVYMSIRRNMYYNIKKLFVHLGVKYFKIETIQFSFK